MSNEGFDTKDLQEICARKKSKYKMGKADFKELGSNILYGSVALVTGSLSVAKGALLAPVKNMKKASSKDDKQNGWSFGSEGWGNYVKGEKMQYDNED
ncbi:hypothetical protein [Pantoea ananatis]|uniref:hypothetical protein n=1 Tax=Pantoea ananas TaxID=553 RepID=UPI001B30BF91|nr:hypothetical protein [Pantoea ananatis]